MLNSSLILTTKDRNIYYNSAFCTFVGSNNKYIGIRVFCYENFWSVPKPSERRVFIFQVDRTFSLLKLSSKD